MKISRTHSLYTAIVMTCMIFSSLATVSADEAGINGIGTAKPHGKMSVKKPDASCDAPGAAKNASASQQKPTSCLVSLSATDKLLAGRDFSLVDVRSSAEYDQYHIPGSINIPLHLVKTKDFLKQQSVELVNDGRTTTELEKTCNELKKSGFDRVTVLDGGLFAWYVSKRSLQGDPVAESKLNLMTADELFAEYEGRALSGWAVIDASTPGKYKDMRRWLPAQVYAIPLKSKGDSIAKISAYILQQRKRNPRVKLLLIADDNAAYERIDAQLRKSGVASSVLHLDAGFKGYREHVNKQVALWPQQKQPRRYQACRG